MFIDAKVAWLASLLASAYFLAALGGNMALQDSQYVSPLVPSVAILMAVLIRSGRRRWIACSLACLPAAVAADLINGERLPVSVGLFGAELTAAVLGAYLLTRFPRQPFTVDTLSRLACLVVLGGMVAPAAGAAVCLLVLFLAYGAALLGVAAIWWLSAFTTTCLIAPAILLWRSDWPRGFVTGGRAVEAGVLAVTGIGLVAIIQTQAVFLLMFLVIPTLLWAAIRFGVIESALFNLALGIVSIGFVVADFGRVENPVFDMTQRVVLMQAYLAFLVLGPSLAVAITVAQLGSASRALEHGESQLRALLDHSPMAIALRDVDGRYLVVNRRFEEWYGSKDETPVGQSTGNDFPQGIAEQAIADGDRVRETKAPMTFPYDVTLPDGKVHHISITRFPVLDKAGEVIAIGSFGQDVTDLIRSEEQLRQAQKMEAVGQLTGGVAHDFNNLLAVMTGNLELSLDAVPADSAVFEQISRALRAAERGAALTHRLLAFSRRQPLDPQVIEIDKTVHGIRELLTRTLGEQIDLKIVTEDHGWLCDVDPGQVEGALLNLALNARDAMPGGGKLTIETANVRLDDDYAETRFDVGAGDYVMIAVSDTGTGMPESVRDRAIEPFFTTKAEGDGSGLGLSMVYGFVRQSGGNVRIYSEEGKGTTVKIYLPRSRSEKADPVPDAPDYPEPNGGGKCVLVVEDDQDVRDLTVSFLEKLGYRTLQASNGKSALEHAAGNQKIDLLLTDVVLADGMSGRDVAEALHATIPNLPVLFMSGYTANAIVHHGRLDPGVALLHKPFRKAEFARAVHAALAKRRAR